MLWFSCIILEILPSFRESFGSFSKECRNFEWQNILFPFKYRGLKVDCLNFGQFKSFEYADFILKFSSISAVLLLNSLFSDQTISHINSGNSSAKNLLGDLILEKPNYNSVISNQIYPNQIFEQHLRNYYLHAPKLNLEQYTLFHEIKLLQLRRKLLINDIHKLNTLNQTPKLL